MAISIQGEVTNLQVKAKKVKQRGEGGVVFESVERVGKLTLEFDAETVDVAELGKLINGRHIKLELEAPHARPGMATAPQQRTRPPHRRPSNFSDTSPRSSPRFAALSRPVAAYARRSRGLLSRSSPALLLSARQSWGRD